MKIIICGDRNWTNYDLIYKQVESMVGWDIEVIEGGAPGADTLARKACEALGVPFEEVEADWGIYGRAAGPIRNREMLKRDPQMTIAFHNDWKNSSKGTRDMIIASLTERIPVIVFTETSYEFLFENKV